MTSINDMDGFVYEHPLECIMYGDLLKLSKTTPKFMVAAYKVEFENKFASNKCLREYLKSLFNHPQFRQLHMKRLEACIVPIMESNIDLVCELMFRDVEFANALPAKFLEVPSVAMSILHRSSRFNFDSCEYDGCPAIFPWRFLTHKVFFESYMKLENIMPPLELIEHINHKFPAFLSTGENIEWTRNVFLWLIRRIYEKKGLSTELPYQIRLLLLTITKAVGLAEASMEDDRIVGRSNWLHQFACLTSTAIAQRCSSVFHIIGLIEHVPRNEYFLKLLRNIVVDRPVHISDCLIACGENTDMMQRLIDLFIRDFSVAPVFRADPATPPVALRYDRRNIYEMLSVWTLPPSTPPTVNPSLSFNWFCNWTANASEAHTLAFIGSFRKDFPRSREMTPVECVNLIPATWRETPSYINKLLTVDWRTLPGVVLEFDQANTSIIISEKLELFTDSHTKWVDTESNLCALSSQYASITTSAMPKFNVMMKACFNGCAGRPPAQYHCKSTDAIWFAYRIAASCDDVAACTREIFGFGSRLNPGTVLCLLPCHLHATLMQDRPFLLNLAAKLPFEISRLPLHSRYDTELIELAIRANPRCATWFDDPSQLLANRNVFDILLSSDVQIPVRDDAGVHIRDHAVASWAFALLPEAQKNDPAIACWIIADERLSVDSRRQLYNSSFPVLVKHNKRCKILACQFFGPAILLAQADSVGLNDPLSNRLLQIVHDGHATSGDLHRAQNSAYLRALSIDLRDAFMPDILTESVKRPADGITYKPTTIDWFPAWNSTDLRTCTFEAPNSYEVYQKMCGLHRFLDNISNLVSMILEPRRRDGIQYPSTTFCEKFEGVQVEFKRQGDDTTPTLVTKAGSKRVHIPDEWKEEMADGFANRTIPEFWGILHAGYGQRSKATKLKNGTLSGESEWSGVTIKIYETFKRDGGISNPAFSPNRVFFNEEVNACRSFLHRVIHYTITQFKPTASEEDAMLTVHRDSVKKGGAGIVFRDVNAPTKFISYDAHGYTMYAEKIVDFLHKYPMHILSNYIVEAEMLGCDDYENPDAEGLAYPDISKVFDQVVNQMRPNKLKRKTSTGPAASKKKACIAESIASKPAPAAASSYWDHSDGSVSNVSDDGDVSDVSSGDVSDIESDTGDSD